MNVTGRFRTPVPADDLRRLLRSPETLEDVPMLSDLRRAADDRLTMVFSPRLALGPVPLDTTVVTLTETAERVELAVGGRHGDQVVDVLLTVDLRRSQAEDGSDVTDVTDVTWSAEVVLRGAVASVGQRVGADLARRAIGDLLVAVAAADGLKRGARR